MKVTIPDELADGYQALAAAEKKSLDQFVTETLRKVGEIAGQSRVLLLGSADLATLDERLGLGSVSSVKDLFSKIDRLSSVAIGQVRLKLSPSQMAEIRTAAEKNGLTPAQEFARRIAQIEPLVFDATGAGI